MVRIRMRLQSIRSLRYVFPPSTLANTCEMLICASVLRQSGGRKGEQEPGRWQAGAAFGFGAD